MLKPIIIQIFISVVLCSSIHDILNSAFPLVMTVHVEVLQWHDSAHIHVLFITELTCFPYHLPLSFGQLDLLLHLASWFNQVWVNIGHCFSIGFASFAFAEITVSDAECQLLFPPTSIAASLIFVGNFAFLIIRKNEFVHVALYLLPGSEDLSEFKDAMELSQLIFVGLWLN